MFVSMGDLFLKTAKKYHLGPIAEAALVCSTFMKVAEEVFSNVSRSPQAFITETTFNKGVLTIKVSNSAVAQEIFLRNEEIMKSINKSLGKASVEKLKVRIG